MANYSSISKENTNNNRSDPSRMNNIDQIRLARLRPEKLDDMAVKEQISLIQKACGDVNPDLIALVFHECDYNIQNTIARIQAGDFDDGGWQTAKSNNKKKNHNLGEQILNGGTLSDSERSLSQRTSPTSSLRGGRGRNDHYQSSRTNTRRRGNDFIPSNSRYLPRNNNPTNKSLPLPRTTVPSQQIPTETTSPSKQVKEQSNEEIPQIIFPPRNEYEFADGATQSSRFENSQKKTSLPSVQSHSSKRRTPSSIPPPVSMHSTIQFSTEPIDIQFGDVQWNDSIPTAVHPSDNTNEQELSSIANTHNHEQNLDVQETLSTNYINHQTTNEPDIQLLETTNRLSTSLSTTDNTMPNNLPIVPAEGTSHLSDHLADTSSPVSTQYSSQEQVPLPIPTTTRLPPTSTPRIPEYTSPINNSATSSAFTSFNTVGNYQSVPRDYHQTMPSWNPQSSNYKTTPKPTMVQTGGYHQQPSYQLPPQQQQQQQQQQQILFSGYPYQTLSPTVVQLFAPIDQWSTAGYPSSLESYTYPTANYIPAYPNQQQYHLPTKYEQYAYDKEFFAHYGQNRSSNSDLSYQQQAQATKDTHVTSKLSPNAASFSQGAPLTASGSATALYLNPVTFAMPTYYPPVTGSTQQDRTLSYPSVDNRDNRNGASYGATNNRNNYYHHGQQRTHNNNASNSTWHVQQ